jgi:hypothetical protein
MWPRTGRPRTPGPPRPSWLSSAAINGSPFQSSGTITGGPLHLEPQSPSRECQRHKVVSPDTSEAHLATLSPPELQSPLPERRHVPRPPWPAPGRRPTQTLQAPTRPGISEASTGAPSRPEPQDPSGERVADERSLRSDTIRDHHCFRHRFTKLQGHHWGAIAPRASKFLTKVRGHNRSVFVPRVLDQAPESRPDH